MIFCPSKKNKNENLSHYAEHKHCYYGVYRPIVRDQDTTYKRDGKLLDDGSAAGYRMSTDTEPTYCFFFLRNQDCISHMKDKVYIATFAKAPSENKNITMQFKQGSPGRLRRRRPEQPPDESPPHQRLEEKHIQDAA